jgi:RNA polymerase sigma-70 factor (ECF subfamily)
VSGRAADAAEHAARESYGRLVAWLAYQWRDVAAAEDAMSAALARALERWPRDGVPSAPDAWLLSVARRELLQAARHQRLHDSPEVQAVLALDDLGAEAPAVPDSRLKLLFVCAHPAIDASIRPALMLQVVLGLDAQAVARAMLASPAAMAQRLVRAKNKIREAGLRFEEPEAEALPERLHAVLEAIYAAYGLGWDAAGIDMGSADASPMVGLRSEALFLGSLVQQLLPAEPEAAGLVALMLFYEARTAARLDERGDFVPLQEQDASRWDRAAIEQAERLLWQASQRRAPGPFQIEAAIQSAHCQRLFHGPTPWRAVAMLYGQLLAMAPSVGAQVAHAVAWAQAGDLARAGELLRAIEHPRLEAHQPYWVARAHIEHLAANHAQAASSLARALDLTTVPAVRRHLSRRQAEWGCAPPDGRSQHGPGSTPH